MNKRIAKKMVKSILSRKPWQSMRGEYYYKERWKNCMVSIIADDSGGYELGMWYITTNQRPRGTWLSCTEYDVTKGFVAIDSLAKHIANQMR